MNMDEWMVIVVAIIAITACVKTGILISRNQNSTSAPSNSGNQAITLVGNSARSATETGPMIYYANDNHERRDKEYRFNYKKVNGSWRAYILRMPSLGNRDARSIPTHRLCDDSNNVYICWDKTVNSLKDMQNISRVWADCIQEYIATGKRFGPE